MREGDKYGMMDVMSAFNRYNEQIALGNEINVSCQLCLSNISCPMGSQDTFAFTVNTSAIITPTCFRC